MRGNKSNKQILHEKFSEKVASSINYSTLNEKQKTDFKMGFFFSLFCVKTATFELRYDHCYQSA